MALLFGSNANDVVNHGSASSLDNLQAFTLLYFITCTNPLTFGRWWYKDAGGGTSHRFNNQPGTNSEVNLFVKFGGTNAGANTTDLSITADVPHWVVATFDVAASPMIRLYGAPINSSIVEGSYGFQDDGTSGKTADAAGSWMVGNNNTPNAPTFGKISLFMAWNRALPLGELLQQQSNPHFTPGNIIFSHYGIHGASGAGVQQDWSGNGNHGTVTGATKTDHAPIQIFPRPRNYWAGWAAAGYPGPFPLSRPVFN